MKSQENRIELVTRPAFAEGEGTPLSLRVLRKRRQVPSPDGQGPSRRVQREAGGHHHQEVGRPLHRDPPGSRLFPHRVPGQELECGRKSAGPVVSVPDRPQLF